MKKILPLFAATLIVLTSFLIPEMEHLSTAGIRTIALIVAFLVLLITEALPLTITCWTALALMPLVGVSPSFGSAISGFASPVMFFILASFGLSAAFTTLPLSKRLLALILKRFGGNIRHLLFAIMMSAATISGFVSAVPTAVLFMSITLSFLELIDDEQERKSIGRAFMIGIPVSCLFGGVATPVGSTMNLLALDLLMEYTGQTIAFVHWMAIGIPVVALILPVAWILIYKIYKPADIRAEMITVFVERMDIPPKMSAQEKKTLFITVTMATLWILSSWFSQISVVVVALLGTCALFFPGIKVLEWKSFIKGVNLDPYFLLGAVLSLGAAMGTNGVSDWIVTLFPTVQMSLPFFIAFVILLVFAVLIIMPVGPSVIMFLAFPLIALAQATGHSPELVILTLAFAASHCYLLPFDTIPLITYGTGYYSILDMPKSTFFLQIWALIVMTIVIFAGSMLLGVF